jgi:peptidoglycan/xylan/chitin deacetylase (PgdA/CDA1 family)
MRPLDLVIHALSSRVARPLFRRIMRGRSTIFMLHRVTDAASGISGHSLEFVQQALETLRSSGARFVSVRQIIEAYANGSGPGDHWVAFTIDDGFADQGELARRAFAAYDCPVTIFLITGLLDNQLWPWDDRLSFAIERARAETFEIAVGERKMRLVLQTPKQRQHALEQIRNYCKSIPNSRLYELVDDVANQLDVAVPVAAPPQFRPLTWEEARALEGDGVEFGPHSVTHRIFSQLTPEEARNEISVSWRRLQEELRRPLPVFAWPTGRASDYTQRDATLLRELGLIAYATTDADYTDLGRRPADLSGPYALRRFSLPDRIRDVLQNGSWIERGKQIARRTVRSSR